jgi:hypothetical protein
VIIISICTSISAYDTQFHAVCHSSAGESTVPWTTQGLHGCSAASTAYLPLVAITHTQLTEMCCCF